MKLILQTIILSVPLLLQIHLKAQICFEPLASYSLHNVGALALCSMDFNNDGKLDFATANSNGLSLHLQQASGGFGISLIIDSISYANTICTADFNNDSKADIAAHQYGPGIFAIYLGNGDGTFAFPITFNTGLFNVNNTICSNDFNLDGNEDLAISTSFNQIKYYPGHGDGTFGTQVLISTPMAAYGQLISQDFNNDGKKDLATSNMLLLGDGLGGFLLGTTYGYSAQSLLSDDFNHDGKLDIVTKSIDQDSLSIFIGNGLGGLSNATSFGLGDSSIAINPSRNLLASGDYNNDGKRDIAMINLQKNDTVYTTQLSILLGDGAGDFSSPFNVAIGNYASELLSLDINADAGTDLVFLSRSLIDSSKLKILYDCNPTNYELIEQNNRIIKIFPNPSNGFMHLESKDTMHKIMIYDLLGNLIFQSNLNTNSFIHQVDKAGIYIFKIQTLTGNFLQKIIINN